MKESLEFSSQRNVFKKTEDQIIEKIIANQKIFEGEGNLAGLTIHELRYGNKKIELLYDPQGQEAYTYIKNIKAEKEANQTTILYKTIKKIIEQLVEKEKCQIIYTLRTENENMYNWAKKKGEDVFQWGLEWKQSNERFPTIYFFSKLFMPKRIMKKKMPKTIEQKNKI